FTLLPDLTARSTEPELMDSPSASPQILSNTLRHFRFINKCLPCHRRLLKRFIINDMLQNPAPSATLLDLGAGVCDIDLWLARACKTRGLRLDILAVDRDPRIVDYARKMLKGNTDITITVVCADALDIDRLG